MYAPHSVFMSEPFYAEITLQATVLPIGAKLLISWISSIISSTEEISAGTVKINQNIRRKSSRNIRNRSQRNQQQISIFSRFSFCD